MITYQSETIGSAKYNAGMDIALYINYLLKLCGLYSRAGDFVSWNNTLKELNRWISPKLKKKNDTIKVDAISIESSELFKIYQKKIMRNRKVSSDIIHKLYSHLEKYEKEIRFYIDKYNMGMPESEDPRYAL